MIAFSGPGTVTVNDAQIQADSHVSLTPMNYVDGTVAWRYHDIVDGVSFQVSLYNAVPGAINFSYAIF